MKNKVFSVFTALIMLLVLTYMVKYSNVTNDMAFQGYINLGAEHNQVKNLVTSVLLDFRVLDTLFETLLLLVSIIAIFKFTSLEAHEAKIPFKTFDHDHQSHYKIARYIMSIVYPLFVILGAYIIVNGADSPGGGFQGGAILATLVMSRYIVTKESRFNSAKPYTYEKYLYILIILLVGIYLILDIDVKYIRLYVLFINILIGLKVASGFSAIIINFMKGDQKWK